MKLWALKSIGFVVGAGLAILLEFMFLMLFSALAGKQLVPRGLGCVVFPVVAGIAAARLAPEVGPLGRYASLALVKRFWAASATTRLVVVAPVFWVLAVGAFVVVFEPYGFRMYSSEYAHMFKVMFFPPVVLVAGYFAYKKLILGNDKKQKDET